MWNKIKGGTTEIVEGLVCNIPPKPNDSLILNFELKKSHQFWRKTPKPDNFLERMAEEEYAREKQRMQFLNGEIAAVTHVDPVLNNFRKQEWHRRWFGYWFYNNGVPTYITGGLYYYLNYCYIMNPYDPEGMPTYYDAMRKRFYFRAYCENDPMCMGYVFIGGRGYGKCLGKGTMVRMYHGGVKKVEDVKVGDLLMGPDSTPRKVLKLHSGIDDMFEVEQNQGMNYVCNKEHVISLRRNPSKGCYKYIGENGKEKTRYPDHGEFITNIPVKELVTKSKKFFSTFSGYKVGVEYKEKPTTLDPYFLGVWLGDGNSDYPIITSMDNEIVQFLNEYAVAIGMKCKERNNGESISKLYTMVSTEFRSSPNPILNMLREMNLINNKHIPFNYLYNTRKIRLEVLAGIIDTDGYQQSGVYEVVQKRKNLAYDVKMLADTLGFKTNIATKTINEVDYYRVFISGHKGEIPVRIKRKKCNPSPNKDHQITRINGFNYLGKGEYFGFELDGDHLFLLEDGTVTHNTSEELSRMLESLTRPPFDRQGTIQSMSESHAKEKVFQGRLRPMWDKLIPFFKPIHDHGTKPQSGLSFFQYTEKGKASQKIIKDQYYELGNVIDIAIASVEAIDSSNRKEVLNTEIGKTSPHTQADVYKRASTNLRCVYRNNVKVGMLRCESTVEEMDEGGAETEMLWNESNQHERNELGFSTSKLYRYFQPQDEVENQFANEFGFVDREKATANILLDRESVKHNRRELVSRMRKSPLSIKEAFLKDATKCLFNVQVLNDNRNELQRQKTPKWVAGYFKWEGEKDGNVIFVEDNVFPKFKLGILLNEQGSNNPYQENSTKLRNNVKAIKKFKDGQPYNEYFPLNGHLFRLSADPIKFKRTHDPRASKFGGTGFHLYDHNLDGYKKDYNEWHSYNYMMVYQHRPDDPLDAYEDMIMAMRYFGAPIFPEDNITEFTLHLVSRGYKNFILNANMIPEDILEAKNRSEYGAASTDEIIEKYTSLLMTFINKHGRRNKFMELVDDWYDFDTKNTTKFDLAVASGFNQLALQCTLPDFEEFIHDEISDWVHRFDNNDNQAHPILGSEGGDTHILDLLDGSGDDW